MHDPCTVAFDIKYPWRQKPTKFFPEGYRPTFITIWHVDPEKDGSDDSCGWFKRARHGDKPTLEAIRKEFEFEWDKDHGGWFDAAGKPTLSTMAITLEMFRVAGWQHFGRNRKRVNRFMSRHLIDILHFAENNVDSMHPLIVGKYGVERREDRIASAASIVYGYILRAEQPWYKHARWHFWHWRLQVHPLQKLKRRLFDRCEECKRPFGWNESPVGNWSGDTLWHSGCYPRPDAKVPDRSTGAFVAVPTPTKPKPEHVKHLH